jgi:hypothetical protein
MEDVADAQADRGDGGGHLKEIAMKLYSAGIVLVLCMSVALLTTKRVYTEDGGTGVMGVFNAQALLSDQKTERERGLEVLRAQYNAVKPMLLNTLYEARAKFRDDRTWHSPLHTAILAVDKWRVLEADETLITIVDYSLDEGSIPDGILTSGDDIYPAAKSLVRLRVNIERVAEMIKTAENPTKLRILTWVYFKRAASIEKAKASLMESVNKSQINTEKQNINQAIELLSQPSDLLPQPKVSDQ